MMAFGRNVLLLVLAATVAFGQSIPTDAGPTPAGYHWAREETPFNLRVGDNVSGGWDDRLQQSIANWNANGTVTYKLVAGTSNPQSCPATIGMVEVCNGQYGTQVGWLGLTRLTFNAAGDHIASATVQFNDSFFDQSGGLYNSEAARQHTACHEMGHSLGLDHANNNSCMNDSDQAIFNNLTPTNQDFNAIAQLYGHSDATSTIAGSDGSSKKSNDKSGKKKRKKHGNRDGGKNRNKHGNRNGGKGKNDHKNARDQEAESEGFFEPTALPSVPSGLTDPETAIVETLEDGRKVVTFVTWAQE